MSEPRLKIIRPASDAEKATKTTLDTIEVTPELVATWHKPPFQRPLKINDKVGELAAEIMTTEVLPGVITLGVLNVDGVKTIYILDGQHRLEAFKISRVALGFADVRFCHFTSMADMGDEFVKVNSRLVNMTPDDILRGLEGSTPSLAKIRAKCPFIGYASVRRNEGGSMLSMSSTLRCWLGSATEVPNPSSGGRSATSAVKSITDDDAETMSSFCNAAFAAWKKDEANFRLWGNLNLCLCMWLYRRMVVTQYSPRTPKLNRDLFTKCLMSLSADANYTDWLVGRQMRSKDLAPAYSRVKAIFVARLELEMGKRPLMPAPAWSTHQAGGRGR